MANQVAEDIIKQLEQSIEALESRNAFQDDVIEQLSQELTVHQEELSALKEQIKLLVNRVKNQQAPSLMSLEDEPPPPHY
ncbi:SlyX family protein [Thalassotalea sp. 1_MG-2023]|uniref:SlyX family protein n=1 Tax=Thalassotalea sp. 1_MG-2023 TaxID=3062680 RepID=UPI0026E325C8|nr:SlyX family protein [Thalassotalea sp. 1_MG-2023]MDO6425723.1 SlyX family protein [Thalassotalea sp. 1_MG-2023]